MTSGAVGARGDDRERRQLARIMAARLALAVAVFGLALVFVGAGNEGAEELESGLYGTLAASFASALLFAAALPFVQQLRRYAALQLAIDVAIVTSLVLFSGAERSIFSFLYLPIAVYGGMLFDRRGGYGAAVASSLGYGAVLWLAPHAPGPLGSFGAPEVKFALWGVHTGALLLVALLASTLVRDLREAGERLDASRQDLEDLQSLHERTIACLTSGLLTLDAQGHISSFNPEAERITGWSAPDSLGQPLERVIPGADALLRAPGASARVRTRLAFQRRDGRPGHLGVAVSPMRGPAGESGHVVIFQDVTEVVRMEQELVRSERLAGVGQLAADIAHEVRNPLAAISGCIEMLRQAAAAPSGENARLMEIVMREVSRLDALIGDFLRYARPAPPKLEDVAVRPILDEIAQLARAAREGVRVCVDAPPGLRVHADASQLRQVVWNLVRNAQQAVGEGGEVRLLAAQAAAPQAGAGERRNLRAGDAGQVTITVSDNGDGIAPEALERIFDPFFTTKAGGTGLGLATVHRIVESHGGSIEVTSRPGEGASFRVRLAAGGATA